MTHYKPKYFDWQAHEDVDDMFNVETVDDNITEEETLPTVVPDGSKKGETAAGDAENKSTGEEVNAIEGGGENDGDNGGATATTTTVEENVQEVDQHFTESVKAKAADDAVTAAARIAVEEEDEQNAAATL